MKTTGDKIADWISTTLRNIWCASGLGHEWKTEIDNKKEYPYRDPKTGEAVLECAHCGFRPLEEQS